MCTVTFIPLQDSIFITHNRDEQKIRSKAVPPARYQVNGYTLLFPKDGQAGGSWIGVNENGHSAVLLNGAFVKHVPLPPYRKSRGLVFLDILASPDLLQAFQRILLENIEPFTIILWNGETLAECRWDAKKKHVQILDATKNHVWSSATLYGEETVRNRNALYEDWQSLHPFPSSDDIIRFHYSEGDEDTRNGLRLNSNNLMLTVSITQIELTPASCKMKYYDLQDGSDFHQELPVVKAMAFHT
jgi:hypothetical protein